MNTVKQQKIRIIRNKPSSIIDSVKALVEYKEVFWRLFLRELQVRYRQTLLGFMWVIIQPALAMGIFSLMLGKVKSLGSQSLPYSVFVLSGLIYWFYFSNCISRASSSLVDNRDLIKKVYFPRAIIPLAILVSNFIDLFIGFVILCVWCIFFSSVAFGMNLFLAGASVLILFLFTFGLSLFLSALCVRFRDVKYTVPFVIQIWFFSTPIVYSMFNVPLERRWLVFANPLAVAIQLLRDALFGMNTISINVLILTALGSFFVLIVGMMFFGNAERKFADIV